MRFVRWLGAIAGSVVVVGAGAVIATWAPDRPVEALIPRWAPPPSQFVDVLGARVHVRDEGPRTDDHPLVLLHGTSASLHTWDGWARALTPERRVIRFDLPGFGLTGPMPDPLGYDLASYVRFVTATLDALGVERFAVAGNSFGGNVAWEIALAHPQRVEALVLVDSAGYPLSATSIPIGFKLARLPIANRLFEVILPRDVVAASMRNVYGDPSRVTEDQIDRYFELTLRAGNRRALVRRFEAAALGDRAGQVQRIRTPTLVLWGGRDRLIPPANAARFHAEIPGSELVVFDALGHIPQEEDPEASVVPVRAFLALLSTRTATAIP